MKWKYQNLNLRRKFYCVGVATWDELLVSCKIDYLTLLKKSGDESILRNLSNVLFNALKEHNPAELCKYVRLNKKQIIYIVDLLKETYIWKIHVKKFGDEFDIYCGGNVIKILRVR